MNDPLKKRLNKIKLYRSSLKRRTSLYTDLAKIDDKNTAESIGSLNRAPAPGKKLQKIGFILLWIPEPTGATIAAGGPMILAGRFLDKKYNGATIKDIGEHTKRSLTSLHDFKKSIF
ncbi:MAG: hypothetical protein GWN01_06570 [Nitrosopumilaceae archaeon]|nr:hypothetical protein [Nitrosopumilaceae archaeon]NIU00600.1 hypothetical protein [Nitrosopumilaceae archaeon]NIU86986.1 hypothetical protein [Nitrosopumilaceae archaeon]NIV66450.1 hypothetical protein [Nitrosopumilaceae archaeon]NIX61202.1 hypothetical protein [Nitrosopumilaceae archaeon]